MKATLISNTAFGNHLLERLNKEENLDYIQLRSAYDEFLSRPLTLGQFVPCDLEGNFLEKPKEDFGENLQGKLDWQLAIERIIFKGFELVEKHEYWFTISIRIADFYQEIDLCTDETIEDLLTYSVDFDWELTDSISKELGLTK